MDGPGIGLEPADDRLQLRLYQHFSLTFRQIPLVPRVTADKPDSSTQP
jgi:hypothetical protein